MKSRIVVSIFLVLCALFVVQGQQDLSGPECFSEFVMPELSKPVLDISNLEFLPDGAFYNPSRVVAQTFGEQFVYIASTASSECYVYIEGNPTQLAGVIWEFDPVNGLETHTIAIDHLNQIAVDLAIDLQSYEIKEQLSVEFLTVPEQAENVPPIDVSIRASSICFVMLYEENYIRYCLHEFSSVELYPEEYDGYVQAPLEQAAVALAEGFGIAPSVYADFGVSEIQDPEHIFECNEEFPSNCAADIVFGVHPDVEQGILGILVVREDLPTFGIPAGDYMLHLNPELSWEEAFENPAEGQILYSGLPYDGDPIIDAPLDTVAAPFFGEDDQFAAEIVGLKLLRWCWGECP